MLYEESLEFGGGGPSSLRLGVGCNSQVLLKKCENSHHLVSHKPSTCNSISDPGVS